MPWFVLVTKTTCSGIGIHNLAFGFKKNLLAATNTAGNDPQSP